MSEPQLPRPFGKYILVERLATGGMAEVYRAKFVGVESFQRFLAIKCILPAFAENEQFISMLVDEANLAGQLSHANIAQIYELGRCEGRLYIAMELVEGRDLRDVIARSVAAGQTIPVGFAAFVVSKVAEGLDYAHHRVGIHGQRLNLVHRDVSPQNILVSYQGEVKLVDFGIAKASARVSETQANALKGKLYYMAPEQVRTSVPIDRRTDIFTLGNVLYELMSGKKLFDGDSDFDILEKVRNCRIPDFSKVLLDAPPRLLDVMGKALAAAPEQRYPRASQMARELELLRIEGQRIFGATDAAEFMETLYADEVVDSEVQFPTLIDLRPAELLKSVVEKAEGRAVTQSVEMLAPTPSQAALIAAGSSEGNSAGASVEVLAPARPLALKLPPGLDDETTQPEVEAFVEEDYTEPSVHGSADLHPVLSSASRSVRRSTDTALLAATTDPERAGFEQTIQELRPPGLFDESRLEPGAGVMAWVRATWGTSRGRIALITTGASLAAMLAVTVGAVIMGTDGTPVPVKAEVIDPNSEFGYLTVTVSGVKSATIYLNGKLLGKAPLESVRVPIGAHRLRVVEDRRGRPGRVKTRKVNVTRDNTRDSPVVRVVYM